MYFFIQSEDGIRDYKVTGVQTCALPIYRPQPAFPRAARLRDQPRRPASGGAQAGRHLLGRTASLQRPRRRSRVAAEAPAADRSEVRRVGIKWLHRGWLYNTGD